MYSTPSFSAGQVGYIYENNSFTAYTAINTWLSLASITVPAGIYIASAAYCILNNGNSVSYIAIGTSVTDSMEYQNSTPGIRNAVSGIFTGPITIYLSYSVSAGSSALETARNRFRVVRIA
jgi:hypothetical protein